MSYLGNSPGVASQRIVTSALATEGQTRIATDSGYVKGYVDVVINGIDMVAGVDFTEAGDGINIDMVLPLTLNDTIKVVAYIPRGLSDGYLKSEADDLLTKTLGLSSFRNRIINGDMKISQRGSSFATATFFGGYTLDRYRFQQSSASSITISQSTDVPVGSGLSNSLRATVTVADTSIGAADYAVIDQPIEGYNIADLIEKAFTISFWVKSSKIGIYCLRLSLPGYTYLIEYSISVANTWEKKSFKMLSGLPRTLASEVTNGAGFSIAWNLAIGSDRHKVLTDSWSAGAAYATPNQVNCLDTVGNIFAITGVQLEKGENATDFEFRPIDVELKMCQRYFSKFFMVVETASLHQSLTLPNMMRVAPTVSNDVNAGFTINNVNPITMSIYEGARVSRTISVAAEL